MSKLFLTSHALVISLANMACYWKCNYTQWLDFSPQQVNLRSQTPFLLGLTTSQASRPYQIWPRAFGDPGFEMVSACQPHCRTV
ncbi:hypothetical protein BDW66DRAFT_141874 [Aspergillus desertorum]